VIKVKKKKVWKWVLLCCTVGYKKVTVMDGVKFEFEDLISLYKNTILNEDGQSAYGITKYILCYCE